MPRKVREIISDLKKAGFIERPGKGSHRVFVHPACPRVRIVVSGNPGDDAKPYQEKDLKTGLRGVSP